MKTPGLICSILLFLAGAARAAETVAPLLAAVQSQRLTLEASGNGREQLQLTLRNPTDAPVGVSLAAGAIAQGADSRHRVISLRAVATTVPARGTVDITLPVVALSSQNAERPESFTLTTDTEPRLAGLLQALADQPDAPRATAQLAALCVLEDLDFAAWQRFRGAAEPAPTPIEITQAVDALGLLRRAAPEQRFALAADRDLKRLALRNPWSRAKAMALYGLDLGDGAVPPDVRQLLHTSVGDNCPICRQRALLQDRAGAP